MSAHAAYSFDERKSRQCREAFAERIQAAGPDWIGLADTRAILPANREHFATLRREYPNAVRSRSASDTASSARGAGLLLWRADVERLALIRRRTGLELRHAFAVLAALRAGPL